jgi:hypothetical protein
VLGIEREAHATDAGAIHALQVLERRLASKLDDPEEAAIRTAQRVERNGIVGTVQVRMHAQRARSMPSASAYATYASNGDSGGVYLRFAA